MTTTKAEALRATAASISNTNARYDWRFAHCCTVGHLYQVAAGISEDEVLDVIERCSNARWARVARYAGSRFVTPLLDLGFDVDELEEIEMLSSVSIRQSVGIALDIAPRFLSRAEVANYLLEKARRCEAIATNNEQQPVTVGVTHG